MHLSFFPAFFDKPTAIRFAKQELDENIELALRRHLVTNIPWIFISLLAFALPALIVFLDQSFSINLVSTISPIISFGLVIVWYLLITAYVIENFLFWYFNIYIITDKHLVDINFYTLLQHDVTEVRLEDVQSISWGFSGIISSLFYYGNVYILTAAETQQIDFLSVPKPDIVADRIQDLQQVQEGNP